MRQRVGLHGVTVDQVRYLPQIRRGRGRVTDHSRPAPGVGRANRRAARVDGFAGQSARLVVPPGGVRPRRQVHSRQSPRHVPPIGCGQDTPGNGRAGQRMPRPVTVVGVGGGMNPPAHGRFDLREPLVRVLVEELDRIAACLPDSQGAAPPRRRCTSGSRSETQAGTGAEA